MKIEEMIYRLRAEYSTCCGLCQRYELMPLNAPATEEDKRLIKRELNRTNNFQSQALFVLTKGSDNDILQPQWFVDILKEMPGFTQGPWVINTNSGNFCSVCVWITNPDVEWHNANE